MRWLLPLLIRTAVCFFICLVGCLLFGGELCHAQIHDGNDLKANSVFSGKYHNQGYPVYGPTPLATGHKQHAICTAAQALLH